MRSKDNTILLNATAVLSKNRRDLYIDTYLDLPKDIGRIIVNGGTTLPMSSTQRMEACM